MLWNLPNHHDRLGLFHKVEQRSSCRPQEKVAIIGGEHALHASIAVISFGLSLANCRLDHPAHHLGLIEGRDSSHGFLDGHLFTHSLGARDGHLNRTDIMRRVRKSSPCRAKEMQVMSTNKGFT